MSREIFSTIGRNIKWYWSRVSHRKYGIETLEDGRQRYVLDESADNPNTMRIMSPTFHDVSENIHQWEFAGYGYDSDGKQYEIDFFWHLRNVTYKS